MIQIPTSALKYDVPLLGYPRRVFSYNGTPNTAVTAATSPAIIAGANGTYALTVNEDSKVNIRAAVTFINSTAYGDIANIRVCADGVGIGQGMPQYMGPNNAAPWGYGSTANEVTVSQAAGTTVTYTVKAYRNGRDYTVSAANIEIEVWKA